MRFKTTSTDGTVKVGEYQSASLAAGEMWDAGTVSMERLPEPPRPKAVIYVPIGTDGCGYVKAGGGMRAATECSDHWLSRHRRVELDLAETVRVQLKSLLGQIIVGGRTSNDIAAAVVAALEGR